MEFNRVQQLQLSDFHVTNFQLDGKHQQQY